MPRIPRHFHFVFGLQPQTEPFHVAYYLCLESCLQVNRPDRVTFYYHHEPWGPWWQRIRSRLELVHVPLSPHIQDGSYQSSLVRHYSYAHHADFIRLEKLLAHGGVYADIDTLFVHPLPDELFTKSCVLGRERPVSPGPGRPEVPSLCNALIMAEPEAPFIQRWVEEMPEAFDGSWSQHSCLLADRLRRRYPAEIHVEPERSFYPYMWSREGLQKLLEKRCDDWEGVYSLHLWSHLWWSTRRFDFCAFNGDRLTERFIRQGTITYTLAARRFLPPVGERTSVQRLGHWLSELGMEYWARRHELKRYLQRSGT